MSRIQQIIINIFASYRPNKSRTVRFAFPLLFAMAAFLGASVIDSENQTFIHIDPSTNSVRQGEIFEIDVYVSAHVPVNAVDIALSFPTSQIEVLGIDTGESVITLWTEQPFVDRDEIVLRGGTFRRGFIGTHLIATVNAKAKTSGLATFEVSDSMLLAGDGSGSEVQVSDRGKDSTKLYIANKEGVFTVTGQSGGEIEGAVTLRIITDIDGDGDVSIADVSRFMSAWTTQTQVYDFSGDGRMTFEDFAIILSDAFFK